MNLPDFSTHVGLNQLRQQMGAELISWRPGLDWERINVTLVTTGIEIPPDEIEPAPDGTLEYKGRKVVVYIRDQNRPRSSDPEKLNKFHVSDCSTLQQMWRQGRYERYVVATRSDGLFIVNFLGAYGHGSQEDNVECRLYVCKNCLTRLNYRGYCRRRYEQDDIRNTFKLDEFFERYASEITRVPTETDTSASLNEYTSDWDQVSRRYKEMMGWRCEVCLINLRDMPEFLDAHHINGLRNDNNDENLRALCVGCHAEQPQQQHIKPTPRYRRYEQWRGSQT